MAPYKPYKQKSSALLKKIKRQKKHTQEKKWQAEEKKMEASWARSSVSPNIERVSPDLARSRIYSTGSPIGSRTEHGDSDITNSDFTTRSRSNSIDSIGSTIGYSIEYGDSDRAHYDFTTMPISNSVMLLDSVDSVDEIIDTERPPGHRYKTHLDSIPRIYGNHHPSNSLAHIERVYYPKLTGIFASYFPSAEHEEAQNKETSTGKPAIEFVGRLKHVETRREQFLHLSKETASFLGQAVLGATCLPIVGPFYALYKLEEAIRHEAVSRGLTLKAAEELARQLIEKIGGEITDASNKLVEALVNTKGLLDKVVEIIEEKAEELQRSLGVSAKQAAEIAKNLANDFQQVALEAYEKAKSANKAAEETITNATKSTGEAIAGATKATVEAIAGATKATGEAIAGATKATKEAIQNTFKNYVIPIIILTPSMKSVLTKIANSSLGGVNLVGKIVLEGLKASVDQPIKVVDLLKTRWHGNSIINRDGKSLGQNRCERFFSAKKNSDMKKFFDDNDCQYQKSSEKGEIGKILLSITNKPPIPIIELRKQSMHFPKSEEPKVFDIQKNLLEKILVNISKASNPPVIDIKGNFSNELLYFIVKDPGKYAVFLELPDRANLTPDLELKISQHNIKVKNTHEEILAKKFQDKSQHSQPSIDSTPSHRLVP